MANDPRSERREGEEPAEEMAIPAQVEAALPWIEAHCRFTISNLPHGVKGVAFAETLLRSIPEACARCVPDLTGSSPGLIKRAVSYGLLAEEPSSKVARKILEMLAELTPVIEPRGKRHWTMWIIRLVDPDMQALLKERTPRSQLLAAPVESGVVRPSFSQVVAALAEAEAELSAERSAKASLIARVSELEVRAAERGPAERLSPLLSGAAEALKTENDLLRGRLEAQEGEIESLRNKCLLAFEGCEALAREKQELERRLAALERTGDGS